MSSGQRDYIDPNKRFPDVFRFMEYNLLQFLQILFSTFPPKNLHYSDNDNETDIKIEGQRTDNLKTMDTRPKIVVARGRVDWEGRGIGNFVGSANLSRFNRRFTDINSAPIMVTSFSREDLEADRIAQICFDSIKQFREVIQTFGFLSVKSVSAGQRAIIRGNESRPELTAVPVMVQVQITRNWTLTKTDPVKLREYLLLLNVDP